MASKAAERQRRYRQRHPEVAAALLKRIADARAAGLYQPKPKRGKKATVQQPTVTEGPVAPHSNEGKGNSYGKNSSKPPRNEAKRIVAGEIKTLQALCKLLDERIAATAKAQDIRLRADLAAKLSTLVEKLPRLPMPEPEGDLGDTLAARWRGR